jgi:hypothetical protein
VTARIFVKRLLGHLYNTEPEKANLYGLAKLLPAIVTVGTLSVANGNPRSMLG